MLAAEFLYIFVDDVLLDRELFEFVALRRKHRIKLFVSGIVIALLFSVRLVNFIALIVAIAFVVHIFHGLLKYDLGPSDEQS